MQLKCLSIIALERYGFDLHGFRRYLLDVLLPMLKEKEDMEEAEDSFGSDLSLNTSDE